MALRTVTVAYPDDDARLAELVDELDELTLVDVNTVDGVVSLITTPNP